MLNQYQLFLLLPLTNAFMPKDIIDYLIGVEFTMFNFEFLKIKSLFKIDNLLKDIDKEQTNWYMSQIGIESQSALVNQISLIFVIFTSALIHLGVIIIYTIFQKCCSESCFTRIILKTK